MHMANSGILTAGGETREGILVGLLGASLVYVTPKNEFQGILLAVVCEMPKDEGIWSFDTNLASRLIRSAC